MVPSSCPVQQLLAQLTLRLPNLHFLASRARTIELRDQTHHKGLRGDLVHTVGEVESWEKQAFSLLGIVAVVKFLKRQSLDSFFADFFLYVKVAIVVLAFVLDVR